VLCQLSHWPKLGGILFHAPVALFGFAMLRVFLAALAVLVELQPIGIVAAILLGGVVTFLAVITL
jgi:hypothetical protein